MDRVLDGYPGGVQEGVRGVWSAVAKAHPEAILQFLGVYGELIQPGEATMGVCRDPDDEKFIDCFLAAKADWLVSGDRDLLELEDRRVRVLSPRAFCDRFL